MEVKVAKADSSEEYEDMTYLSQRFQNMVRRKGEFLKKDGTRKPSNRSDYCNKCGKLFVSLRTVQT